MNMLNLEFKRLLVLLFIWGFTAVSLGSAAVLPEGNRIDCEHYDEKNCTSPNDCPTKIEHCKLESDKLASCYVLWSIDAETGSTRIKMKGCFTDMHECNQTECITSAEPRPKNIHFCCCKGSMCNTDQKWIPTTTQATTQVPKEKTQKDNVLYYIIPGCIFLIGTIAGFAFYAYFNLKPKPENCHSLPSNDVEPSNSSPLISKNPIILKDVKATGRFGAVYQGKLLKNQDAQGNFLNQDVAVKIFKLSDKESWASEIKIYKLPGMKHPNILEFLGSEDHYNVNLKTWEYWLITTYQHNGSLCDYLKSHTLTWPELCRIAESMARGLMHLHEEIPGSKPELLKPSVAHRDFKSKNVLLKSDLTACIADFGLAMVFQPDKPCGDVHGLVGTQRYMAPEILEGAINFSRDAFLRIDVYACGLVLWEMVSRCNAVGNVDDYMLPFELELGQRPSKEEIQDAVVTKKMRPQISPTWRNHPGINIICDTMEECWDHDAEARLSSSCVMERFSQLNKKNPTTTQLLIENNTGSSDEAKETTNWL